MPDDMDTPATGDEEYGDGMDAKAPDAPKPEPADGKGGDEQEAILPTGIMQGKDFKVGDEIVLKVTAMHDGQFSVKYAPAKGKDDQSEPDAKAAVPAGMGGGDGESDY